MKITWIISINKNPYCKWNNLFIPKSKWTWDTSHMPTYILTPTCTKTHTVWHAYALHPPTPVLLDVGPVLICHLVVVSQRPGSPSHSPSFLCGKRLVFLLQSCTDQYFHDGNRSNDCIVQAVTPTDQPTVNHYKALQFTRLYKVLAFFNSLVSRLTPLRFLFTVVSFIHLISSSNYFKRKCSKNPLHTKLPSGLVKGKGWLWDLHSSDGQKQLHANASMLAIWT